MSDVTKQNNTSEKAAESPSTLADDIRKKVQQMKQDFAQTVENAKPHVSKDAAAAENPKELLYERLADIDRYIFNRTETSDGWRDAELRQVRKVLTEGKGDILAAFEAEFKRSHDSTQVWEIDPLADELEYVYSNYKYWVREQVSAPLNFDLNSCGYVQHDPHGLVLIIGDWQNPLGSVIKPAINALAAGNHVVLYPDLKTKKIADAIRNVFNRYCDQKRIQVVTTETPFEKLMELPINYVYASGSSEKLERIASLAAAKKIPAGLTREGANVAVVHQSADINLAAEKIVLSKFVNVGQSSTAVDQVYVHTSLFTDFFVKCKINMFAAFKTPESNKDYSRLLTVDYTKYLAELIESKHGGKVENRANYVIDDKLIDPLIITNPDDDSVLLTHPVRGPILVIKKFEFYDDLVNSLSARTNVNNIYFFADNLGTKVEFKEKIRNSNIFINDAGLQNFNFTLPIGSIGGLYNSKIGGKFGFQTFSSTRLVFESTGPRQYHKLFPPFNQATYKAFNQLSFLKRYTVKQGKWALYGVGIFVLYRMFSGDGKKK